MSLLGFLYFFYVSSLHLNFMVAWLVLSSGEFLLSFPHTAPQLVFTIFGVSQPPISRDYVILSVMERGMDGWMVFGCLRGEGDLRPILLAGATVNSATVDA